jgi:hypothetical protein
MRPATEPTCPGAKKGGGECFTAGVPLLTPEGYRFIETLQVGDLVLARDEFAVTGAVAPKVIEKVFVRSAVVLRLHLGGQVIGTTTEHPFYVRDRGWVKASELWVGAELVGHDEITTKITAIEPTRDYAVVYNIRVADWHTYFVGCADWGFSLWAHNFYESVTQAIADATSLGIAEIAGWFTNGSPAERAVQRVIPNQQPVLLGQTQEAPPTPTGQLPKTTAYEVHTRSGTPIEIHTVNPPPARVATVMQIRLELECQTASERYPIRRCWIPCCRKDFDRSVPPKQCLVM